MMAPFNLKGKRILLVGATGVLGSAFSRGLKSAGASLVIADLETTSIDKIASELALESLYIDVTNEKSVIESISTAASVLGGLDGVVSNAAITSESLMGTQSIFSKLEDYPLEDWKKTIDVNLSGTFLVAREAGRLMKMSGGGSIVLTSSIYGVVGPDHNIYEGQSFQSFPGYSASKAGIIGLTKWLATWWAKDGIRVNALSPGGVINNQPNDFVEKYSERTPIGRMAEPDDLTGALLFLLSDSSSYCTGQNLIIDGGLTAW